MKKVYLTRLELRSIKLFDDNSDNGGISYNGETADNFCDEVFSGDLICWDDYNVIPLSVLNKALKECGIKEINIDIDALYSKN